jgi:hypothetical protein
MKGTAGADVTAGVAGLSGGTSLILPLPAAVA